MVTGSPHVLRVQLPLTPPIALPEGDHEDPEWLKYPNAFLEEEEHKTTIVSDDGEKTCLIGVLPPALLTHLADQRVTLLSSEGTRVAIGMRGGGVVLKGTPVVDLSSMTVKSTTPHAFGQFYTATNTYQRERERRR